MNDAPSYEPPAVRCPCCGALALESELLGSFGGRACPHCGGSLSWGSYEEACGRLSDEIGEAHARTDALRKRLALIDRLLAPLRILAWLDRATHRLQRRLVLRDQLELMVQLPQRVEALKGRIASLAEGAYLASGWFQLTHIPLGEGDAGGLHAIFGRSGRIEVKGISIATAGLPAEFDAYRLFEGVRMREAEGDPLAGCFPAPNLYVPRTRRGCEGSPWQQVDLVVLTRSCLFVVEVKRWMAHVRVDEEGRIYSSKARRGSESPACTVGGISYFGPFGDLEQNYRHSLDLQAAFSAYPEDRVHAVTLFVSPRSVSVAEDALLEWEFVGTLEEGRADALLAWMEERCAVDPVLSQEQVDRCGHDLVAHYGDLNQRLGAMHCRRLAWA